MLAAKTQHEGQPAAKRTVSIYSDAGNDVVVFCKSQIARLHGHPYTDAD